MKRGTILITLSVVLVVAILAFTFFGCACWRKHFGMEGFADAPEKKPTPKAEEHTPETKPKTPVVDKNAPLTPQEKELFEDLKNNRLSEEDIKTLVENNVLNEKLVEKFLDKLAPADGTEHDKEEIEGFTSVGNTFACAAFGPDQ